MKTALLTTLLAMNALATQIDLPLVQAANGYAYAGTTPGPIIRVIQGTTINLVLRNQIDLDTTLHPHGVRVDNRFDGVPGVTQPPIKPGEKFTYTITFPDAGIFWYHPHIKDWYVRSRGAYGVFLVSPQNSADLNPVNREEVLVLSDVEIQNGVIAPEDPNNPSHVLMGKFGNTQLINGLTNFKLSIHQGEVVRFYVLNAADVRPFNFQIQGAKMKIVGGDIGFGAQDYWADSVVIAPAERYIVEALFEQAGEYQILNNTPKKSTILGTVVVDNQSIGVNHKSSFELPKERLQVKDDIEKYRPYFNRPIDRKLPMKAGMNMNMSLSADLGNIEWEDSMPGMNAGSNLESVQWKLIDPDTKKQNSDIHWEFNADTPVKIELYNPANGMHAMQHPIHFHGQRFLVLSVNGQPNSNLQWKDTVLVRRGDRTEILLDASNPGDWTFHCHIGRHAVELGRNMTMTGNFHVKPVPKKGDL